MEFLRSFLRRGGVAKCRLFFQAMKCSIMKIRKFKLFFSLFLRLWSNSVNRVLPRDSTPSFFRIFRNKTTFEFFFPVMASRVFFLKLRKKGSVASLLGNRV